MLKNVPRVRDVDAMIQLLCALGVQARWDDEEPNTVRICADTVATPEAPYELVRKMRAPCVVPGPQRARACGKGCLEGSGIRSGAGASSASSRATILRR